jgi:uncharacterized protein YceK
VRLRILSLAVLLNGCATIVSGRQQQLALSVNPPGTIVCINGKQAGTTPMVAKLDRKESYVFLFEHPGYKPAVLAVTQQVNPWIVGNFVPLVLIPGPIGLIVDISTGAVHSLEPTQASFLLARDDSATTRPAREPCSPI